MRRLTVILACLGTAALTASASARVDLPSDPSPVSGNPAEALVDTPIEDSEYDPATRCVLTPRPGVKAMVAWLQETQRGEYWGAYRCERWGKGSASLHAEGRAIDWHLDVADPEDKAAATRLIRLLLAPDSAGEPQALARRMGVEELIWDCSYWAAGMTEFKDYSPCFGRDGTPRKRVDVTTAHRNHIHIGMTKAGAMGRTSFWRR